MNEWILAVVIVHSYYIYRINKPDHSIVFFGGWSAAIYNNFSRQCEISHTYMFDLYMRTAADHRKYSVLPVSNLWYLIVYAL